MAKKKVSKQIVSKKSRPQMSEWEEVKPNDKDVQVGAKRYRIPLDHEGNPAPGWVPIDVTKTYGDERFFGGRLYERKKGTTETSDDGIDIHINKRRSDITGIKYNEKRRKFFDKDGNQVNDADLYYSDKVGIIKRDSTKPHFEDRYRGEYIFSKAPSRSGKSDIEGLGESRESDEESPKRYTEKSQNIRKKTKQKKESR